MISGKIIKYILSILFSLFGFRVVQAQINLNSLGFDIGIIDNVEPNSEFMDPLIIFPEVYIGGDLIKSYLNWEINLGYWNDGQNEPRYSDYSNFSYSSAVINAEIIYLTPHSNPEYPSPIRFLAGLSYHFLTAKDVDRYESALVAQKDYMDKLFYFNSGIEFHLFFQKHLSIFTKGLIYFHINNSEEIVYKSPRFQLSLGLNYQFGN